MPFALLVKKNFFIQKTILNFNFHQIDPRPRPPYLEFKIANFTETLDLVPYMLMTHSTRVIPGLVVMSGLI